MSNPAAPSVLVVGDSRLTAALLSRHLGPRVAVPTVRSGEEALERILLDPSIIAVVCDLTLPGMSGEAFLQRIRRSPAVRLQQMPFVALGGNEDPRRALALVAAGANAYVAKPRAPYDLAPTLATLLPGRVDGPALDGSSLLAHPASLNGAPVVMPIASLLRLRWQSEPASARAGAADLPASPPGVATGARVTRDAARESTAASASGSTSASTSASASTSTAGPTRESGAEAAVDEQIRVAFERHLRARDRWRPDRDGHGGVLGLTCPIEDALRPLLRLAHQLEATARRFDRSVAVAMALETPRPAGTIDAADEQAWAPPELPAAGEMAVVLPRAQFRLKLDRVGPG